MGPPGVERSTVGEVPIVLTLAMLRMELLLALPVTHRKHDNVCILSDVGVLSKGAQLLPTPPPVELRRGACPITLAAYSVWRSLCAKRCRERFWSFRRIGAKWALY